MTDDSSRAAELAEELRLARRELKFVRAEQERMAEQLMRAKRQRSRLKKQAEVTAEALAAQLSDAYWRTAGGGGSTLAGLGHRIGRLARVADPAPPPEEQEMVREVEASDLFDPAWYLRQHLDVAREGVSPAAHYVRSGGQGDPSELFDTKRYLQRTPGARASDLPPLVHHLRHDDAVPAAEDTATEAAPGTHL